MSNIVRGSSTYHNIKKKKIITHGPGNAYFLWPVYLFVGHIQPDIHLWQEVFNVTFVHDNTSLCPLAVILYDSAHTVFVFSMFTLSVTEADSQPNVFNHYGQVHRFQKVCVSGPMFIGSFSCFNGYYHLSKYSALFSILYNMKNNILLNYFFCKRNYDF